MHGAVLEAANVCAAACIAGETADETVQDEQSSATTVYRLACRCSTRILTPLTGRIVSLCTFRGICAHQQNN